MNWNADWKRAVVGNEAVGFKPESIVRVDNQPLGESWRGGCAKSRPPGEFKESSSLHYYLPACRTVRGALRPFLHDRQQPIPGITEPRSGGATNSGYTIEMHTSSKKCIPSETKLT